MISTGPMICGVVVGVRPDGDVVALGRKLKDWARDTALDAKELRRAQAGQGLLVNFGVAWLARAGEGVGARTVRSFRELERERSSAQA